jgi:hypothetical protein
MIAGLVGSTMISEALETQMVSELRQLGPLLIARLIQNICGELGEERLPNIFNIFYHLVDIEGMRGLLVNQWLPGALSMFQKGVIHFGCPQGGIHLQPHAELCGPPNSCMRPKDRERQQRQRDRNKGVNTHLLYAGHRHMFMVVFLFCVA